MTRAHVSCSILLIVFLAVPGSAQPPSRCASPEARGFDFWIGDWEIRQKILRPDGSWIELPARTSVRPALDGCALVEEWTGEVLFFWEGMKKQQAMKGFSVRTYDSRTGQWSIHWMDTRSPHFGSPYVGMLRDGKGEFFREWETPQGRRVGRITFFAIRADSVQWALAVSSDGRRTWQTLWTMAMSRAR